MPEATAAPVLDRTDHDKRNAEFLTRMEKVVETLGQKVERSEQESKDLKDARERIATLEAAAKSVKDRSLSFPEVEDLKKKGRYSLARIALATMPDHRGREKEIAPVEYEVSQELRKQRAKILEERMQFLTEDERVRAINNTMVGSEGGFLVPQEGIKGFYDILWAMLVGQQLGFTKITGMGGVLPFLTKKTTVAVGSIAEGSRTGLGNANPTFEVREAKPHRVGGYAGYTREVLATATPDIDQMMERDLAEQIAQKMDYLTFFGKGSEREPTGIFVGDGAASGAHLHLQGTLQHVTDYNLADGSNTLTIAGAIDWEGVLEDANVPLQGAKFVTTSKAFRKLRKDTANQYVVPGPLSRQKIAELTGYDWVTATTFPTNLVKSGYTATGSLCHAAFGRWQDVLHVMFGGIEIRRSDVAYDPTTGKSAFFDGLHWIMANASFDALVLRQASIVASNEVNYT